ncbi:MAG: WYL domain-containing protein [Bacteroidetes bacterium]|nr:WYL domain-containing protein [Bacteroidota bacterium]
MNYATPPKKMLILNILDILRKYSDENHRLSAKDIGERLEREYSQKVDRKAIKRNLMNLIDFGYQLEFSESIRINKSGEEEIITSDWYLVRDFTDAELRLLIDSLLFSKHIPYNQCKELIEKLEGLSNTYFKAKVKHIRTMPEKLSENKALFYTIEILDDAIEKKKRVQFHYISDYGIDKKPLLHKNQDGKVTTYKVNPYQMAATNGRYYLICTHKYYPEAVSNYRIDRIVDIKLLDDEPITPVKEVPALKNGFDLPKHMAENIYMFGGESVWVKFRAKRYIIKDILDWFGYDARFTGEDDENIIVDVKVSEQAMLYWSLQYGEHIEVLSPESLRDRVGKAAKSIAEKY